MTLERRLQYALAPARIGRLISRPQFVICGMCGSSLDSLSLRGLTVWLNRMEVTEADLARLERELAALPPCAAAGEAWETGETTLHLDLLVRAARAREFGPNMVQSYAVTGSMRLCLQYGPLDWDLVLREVRANLREAARISRLSKRSDQRRELAAFHSRLLKQASAWDGPMKSIMVPVMGNARVNARCLVATTMLRTRSFDDAYIAAERVATARDRLLRAAIAIKRHRLRTGEWPRSLADVTGLDGEGRMDPCVDGGELIYRLTAEGCRVYSVGLNGLDDKGENNNTNPGSGADDITIRLR